MSFKDWAIKKLGGHTQSEYDEIADVAKQSGMNAAAVRNAHDHMLKWFNTPVINMEMQGQTVAYRAATAMREGYPIDVIKHDVCRKISEEITKAGMIHFDVEDDRMTGRKVISGKLIVMVPKSFGMGKF